MENPINNYTIYNAQELNERYKKIRREIIDRLAKNRRKEDKEKILEQMKQGYKDKNLYEYSNLIDLKDKDKGLVQLSKIFQNLKEELREKQFKEIVDLVCRSIVSGDTETHYQTYGDKIIEYGKFTSANWNKRDNNNELPQKTKISTVIQKIDSLNKLSSKAIPDVTRKNLQLFKEYLQKEQKNGKTEISRKYTKQEKKTISNSKILEQVSLVNQIFYKYTTVISTSGSLIGDNGELFTKKVIKGCDDVIKSIEDSYTEEATRIIVENTGKLYTQANKAETAEQIFSFKPEITSMEDLSYSTIYNKNNKISKYKVKVGEDENKKPIYLDISSEAAQGKKGELNFAKFNPFSDRQIKADIIMTLESDNEPWNPKLGQYGVAGSKRIGLSVKNFKTLNSLSFNTENLAYSLVRSLKTDVFRQWMFTMAEVSKNMSKTNSGKKKQYLTRAYNLAGLGILADVVMGFSQEKEYANYVVINTPFEKEKVHVIDLYDVFYALPENAYREESYNFVHYNKEELRKGLNALYLSHYRIKGKTATRSMRAFVLMRAVVASRTAEIKAQNLLELEKNGRRKEKKI